MSRLGRPAKQARLVVGAVIIEHKLCLSGRETVAQIQENPYLQYFVGLKSFQSKQVFSPTLFVDIRKRMGEEVFDQFQQSIVDATVVEQAIRYPTDLGLLNEAREISEHLIDLLYPPSTLTQKPCIVKR